MKPRRWFTPETPDVIGMLQAQAAITLEGVKALHDWAQGDADAAADLGRAQHEADERKRALRVALTQAFVTPLEPEDIFELSRGLDRVITSAKNTLREAELMGAEPDVAMAAMTAELADGAGHLASAFAALAVGGTDAATRAADEATASERRFERAYRSAMSALIDVEDLREVSVRRELYRRLARMGDQVVDVAERIWYSVLKER